MRDAIPRPARLAGGVGVLLIAAGWVAPSLRMWAALGLLGCFVLFLIVGKIIGFRAVAKMVVGLIGTVWLTKQLAVDWRAVGWTVVGLVVLVAVAAAPQALWLIVVIGGLGLIGGVSAGVSIRALQASGRLRDLRVPVVSEDVSDARAARRFRKSYAGGRHPIAHELSWDRDRKGATDRQQIPHLVEARLNRGTWTLVFIARGDWDEAKWETEAHAMRRRLDGRSVHVSHQGRRTVLTIHTADLPKPGEITIREVPRITDRGILLGHDAARREIRWEASEAVPHGLVVGATGGGKTVLCSSALLQAAATPGWEAVLLDGKQTIKWLWLERYGVRVIRRRDEIHDYLAWLEEDRQRVEELGRPEVTRLVVLDEARFIIGKRPGKAGKRNAETSTIVGDLTGLGRSAGLRLLLVIQRPDVDEIGGGYTRSNLALRAALGAIDEDGRDMVFKGYTVSPQEVAILDGTPGRMVVAGIAAGDRDGHAVQVPLVDVDSTPPVAGGAEVEEDVPPNVPALLPPPGGGGTTRRGELRERILEGLPGDGSAVRLTVFARDLEVPVDNTLRRAVRDLEAEGAVVTGRGPRGAVTLALPVAGVPMAGSVRPVAAAGVSPT